MPTSNEKWLASVGHLSFLLGLPIFVPLIMYLWQRDKSPFVAEQSKQATLLHLALLVFCFLAMGVSFITVGFGLILAVPAMIVVSVLAFCFSVIAVLKIANGESYRYPLIGHLFDGI